MALSNICNYFRVLLLREGDFFGAEHFGAGVGDLQETKTRTATAVSRTAPCELLTLPPRYGE